MALDMHVTTGYARLVSHVEEWRELLGRSAQDQPTLAPEWVLPWCRVYAKVLTIHVGVVRSEGRMVGLAPFVVRRRRHRRVFNERCLELVGTGEAQADEVLSEYVGVMAERGLEEGVAAALARAVAQGRFGQVDALRIPAMNGEDLMAAALRGALRDQGWRAELSPWAAAPYAVLPGTWEAFLEGLPGRRRQRVRRSERVLEEWAGEPPRLRVALDSATLEEGQRVLEQLHRERWLSAGHGGAFVSAAFSRFHSEVMPAFLSRGGLDLLWLEAKGRPIAVLYNLVWGNKVYHYQSGRSVDLPRPLKPGLAIHAQAIRRSIDLGRREYDFLGEDHRYKRELSSQTRPLIVLEALRPGARHALRLLVDRAAGVVGGGRPMMTGGTTGAPPGDDDEAEV
jgi:CelD/BcsL family acetyltransferase involved in cellulose biosynthesis